LIDEVLRRGLIHRKLSGLGHIGWPDRMVLGHGGRIAFIEVKRPGQVPTVLQSRILQLLQQLGFYATYIDNIEDGKKVLEEVFPDTKKIRPA